MPISYFKPIAVIDEVGAIGRIGIWHVDVGHTAAMGAPMPRMAGAWGYALEELDPWKVRSLIEERFIVLAGDTDLLERLAIAHRGIVDVSGTVECARTEVTKLQDAFEAHAAGSRTKLTAPDWPEVPDPVEVAASVPMYPSSDERTGQAYPLARGFEKLAIAWEKVEKQRVQRPFLKPLGGDELRPLPLVTR
ncbi:hypothetical protein [Rhodococcus sp. T7]|uniref:hypothetical protein n=1 Tax=Rhodococcus sp. T7 TaxID=627444 RepID=UPI0013575BED|nr:hypothetical protein [Rhodococcus sp. T7]KAF0957668.1 hypothetical protein MLGJGCBP_09500 [Rhodococcus sp. T7]KAF0963260.1 hypothetical protein MLGJGCBP_03566 [Rhodococcus sp. T7]